MAPEDVRCVALTSTSLQVSWQPPPAHHTNGLLQGYKLNFEQVLDNLGLLNDAMDTRKTTALTIVLSNLRRFTNYSMQVLAYTRMGDGVLSGQSFCQTEEDGEDECGFLFKNRLNLIDPNLIPFPYSPRSAS